MGVEWGSAQGGAEQYREKTPGDERWQERLVLLVVTGINRDVTQEAFALTVLLMTENHQYCYLPPQGISRDTCP